jgi:hypothetical protein
MNGFLKIWSSIFHIKKVKVEIISEDKDLFGKPKEGNYYRAFKTRDELRKAIVLISNSCTDPNQATVRICRAIGPCHVTTLDGNVSFHFENKIVETF